MQITVELPDDIARHPDPGREALERLAIEGYRSGALTHHQAGQLLGLSRFEFDDFLIEHGIDDHAYSITDLQQDLADLEKLRAQGLIGK
jgi:predicted HTH domain antitoxin